MVEAEKKETEASGEKEDEQDGEAQEKLNDTAAFAQKMKAQLKEKRKKYEKLMPKVALAPQPSEEDVAKETEKPGMQPFVHC